MRRPQHYGTNPTHTSAQLRLYKIGLSLFQRLGLSNDSLDADSLLQVVTATGSFGELQWPAFVMEGLHRLSHSLEQEAGLNSIGRRFARQRLLRALENTALRLNRPQQSEISESLSRPLFILSLPRTGSTLAHNMLAACSGLRAPLLWELQTPLTPEDAAGNRQALCRQMQKTIRDLGLASPAALDLHPMAEDRVDECHYLYENSLACPSFLITFDLPGYRDWLEDLESIHREQVVEAYRQDVIEMMTGCRRHWLSKTPVHLFFIKQLYRAFPGARYIRLHRDPADALLSFCQLLEAHRRVHSDQVSLESIGATAISIFRQGMEYLVASDALLPESAVIDISYSDILQDPGTLLRQALGSLGYESQHLEPANLEQLPRPPRRLHMGRQTLNRFGIASQDIDSISTEYRHWAGIRSIHL